MCYIKILNKTRLTYGLMKKQQKKFRRFVKKAKNKE